jgi:hypothetical protein
MNASPRSSRVLKKNDPKLAPVSAVASSVTSCTSSCSSCSVASALPIRNSVSYTRRSSSRRRAACARSPAFSRMRATVCANFSAGIASRAALARRLIPTTPDSRPSASRNGQSVTCARSSVPSRRRTVSSPDHDSPRDSAAMISAARSRSSGAGVTSSTFCPSTSSFGQPYSSSAPALK